MPGLSAWLAGSLLLSLRLAPTLAFAPPFTLIRIPAVVRMLMALGVSACMVAPVVHQIPETLSAGWMAAAAIRELMVGVTFALAFQLTFGAIYFVGRTLDIQAGFGLAALIDPTTRNQMPLIGAILAYAGGAIFFALNGHLDLVRIVAASLDVVPIGGWRTPADLGALTAYVGAVFLTAFGVGGGAILGLFLIDMTLAILSRTVPQMNVLVLGFQVKTLALLIILPLTFGVAGAVLARLAAFTLESLTSLI